MLKTNKTQSLSDKISDILNAVPKSYDPEDDLHEETSAKVVDDNDIEEEDDDLVISKFRKENLELLEDVDKRYVGKKSSRKELAGSDEDFSEDDCRIQSEKSDASLEQEEDDYEVSAEEEDEQDDEAESLDGDQQDLEESDNFKHISDSAATSLTKKGANVRQQLQNWENLVEMRIQFQKCLLLANSFHPKNFESLKSSGGEEFVRNVSKTKGHVSNLLEKLLHLQLLLARQFSETKNLYSTHNQNETSANDDDEEIPSDTEEEVSEKEEHDDDEPVRKRKKLSEFKKVIGERHDLYKPYRNSVIQKWNEKTRVAVSTKNAPIHSVVNHIEHILGDKEKLIARTQLKRNNYKVIGIKNEGDTENDQYDTEIFDDSDFYQQILRELIEYKSADVTDPVQLGRQWVQLQSMRSKMKRNIDTKATKGRKIRYVVHPKLVNFMAPIDEGLWKDEAKNELYSSLFGKNQIVSKV